MVVYWLWWFIGEGYCFRLIMYSKKEKVGSRLRNGAGYVSLKVEIGIGVHFYIKFNQ